jgi:hypothetical protein
MAAAAPEVAPTFNWTGMGRPEGSNIHYQSFNFAGQHYTLGDCVYLLPEEEGSPPYIARLVRAYEDTNAKEAERLVIEVCTPGWPAHSMCLARWLTADCAVSGYNPAAHALAACGAFHLALRRHGCADALPFLLRWSWYWSWYRTLHMCHGVSVVARTPALSPA